MIVYSTEIHALGNPKYKLQRPLLVTIYEYDKEDCNYREEVVAHIPEFGLYGSAVSEDLALLKLKDNIVSTYECLSALAPDMLGRLMYCCLEAMNTVIVFV